MADDPPRGAAAVPYGAWPSPISARSVAEGGRRIDDLAVLGEFVCWLERRPEEGGRNVLVCRDPDGGVRTLTPEGFDVRSRVHEYGGGAFCLLGAAASTAGATRVGARAFWPASSATPRSGEPEPLLHAFVNFADQRVYLTAAGASAADAAVPLTPADGARYADLVFDSHRHRLIAVQERPGPDGGDEVASLVAIALPADLSGVIEPPGAVESPGAVEPPRPVALVSGADFFSSPRLSPGGNRLAWLSWNHPDMPWDTTTLHLADLDEDGLPQAARVVAGGDPDRPEAVQQPSFDSRGRLVFVSDRGGWWNLYRAASAKVEPLCPRDAEFGRPPWVFGTSTYAHVPGGIVAACCERGGWGLEFLPEARDGGEAPRPIRIATPYTSIGRSAGPVAGQKTRAPSGADAGRKTRAPSGADAGRKTRAPSGADAGRKTRAPSGADAGRKTRAPSGADAGRKTRAPSGTDAGRKTRAPSGGQETRAPSGRSAAPSGVPSVFFLGGAPDRPAEIVRLSLADPAAPELDVLVTTGQAPDPRYLSTGRHIEFPSAGGRRAFAFFYPPKNDDVTPPAGARPPLIVMSHGGPTSAAEHVHDPGVQFWTSRGFAVVDVNYGGSTGYGSAYRESLRGRWGIVDVEDCAAAAEALAARGEADPARLLIRGGSAGGYSTLAALAFTDTFAAGASHYGVADLAALARDTHKFESRYLDGLVGPYPERADLYRERSPLEARDRFSCPVIFFQGDEDRIVPPNQAEAMVEALRAKGVRVDYHLFEGEQHGFRRAGNIVRALEAELAFYGEVLGFEPP